MVSTTGAVRCTVPGNDRIRHWARNASSSNDSLAWPTVPWCKVASARAADGWRAYGSEWQLCVKEITAANAAQGAAHCGSTPMKASSWSKPFWCEYRSTSASVLWPLIRFTVGRATPV